MTRTPYQIALDALSIANRRDDAALDAVENMRGPVGSPRAQAAQIRRTATLADVHAAHAEVRRLVPAPRPHCVAPVDAAADPRLCGARATEERTVEGVVCPLCHRCALEIDGETDVN